ncbi:DUF4198 domain-containing protein [Desulfogranum japonicum]|uniref:DUF4198 domain-containing protein n=1 Tax=Desulfogranum japonicum TaxID=231447 RepID=UPI00048D21AE
MHALCVLSFAGLLFQTDPACAHFGMLIPDTNHVTQEHRSTSLQISFSHPFAGIGMDMEKPRQFFSFVNGEQTDLLSTLQPTTVMEHKGWQSEYSFSRPGVYSFVVEPEPYWEPAEDVYIIHYTKTVVAAFGDDSDWDTPIGLKTEIVPLLRPFGNYAGNTFVGKVLVDGKPVANTEVEVELYNQEAQFSLPSEYHETQVIQTDEQGVFTFSCPQAGWWGFAALTTADYTLPGPDKTPKEVEQGAVLWLYFDQWK